MLLTAHFSNVFTINYYNRYKHLFTFYTVQQMHTKSFTNPQILKIGLTHKNSPRWSRQLSQRALSRASEGEAHGCAFQRRKDARSRHQCLFVENIGKTEKGVVYEL